MEIVTEDSQNAGLLVTGDLIFSTKITGTARALGLEVEVIGSAGSTVERVRSASPRCILLDLSVMGLTSELMREIVSAAAGGAVLAFGSHVDTARLQAARDAGCTEVMPRSRLSAELPKLLTQYLRA
jgi:DNA-binding NarL/FixJ family response regulator